MSKFKTCNEEDIEKIAKLLNLSYKFKIPFFSKYVRDKCWGDLYKLINEEIKEEITGKIQRECYDQLTNFKSVETNPSRIKRLLD